MRNSRRTSDVALVSMPWGPVGEPSLGLALLKCCLADAGVTSRVFHFAPRLLHWVTIETYEMVAGSWGINEFVFTGLLDDGFDAVQQDALLAYAERHVTTRQYPHPRYKTMRDVYELVLKLRTEIAPAFVDHCVARILETSPTLVGFTCMFDQTLASVAVARRLKEHRPDLQIALGGYALAGDPGTVVANAFPWIDTIVMGDGEEEIVALAREASHSSRRKNLLTTSKVRTARNVDISRSPVPDYSDWFDDIEDLAEECSVRIRPKALPVESSRGCWWGQVKHCTFCGIDEETLKYRFKPAADTLAMLDTLRERHGDYLYRFSDYILPKAYYSDLLPQLAARPQKFRLHCEIKANHPPERVHLLAQAGFVEFQPGIESFSTPVLQRMDKGVRAVDNASLLKAAYIDGLIVDYNVLYGLPGDEAAEYEDMLAFLPRIYHLSPPVARTQTVITRFAPLQQNPERFGVARQSHHHCYDVLFSEQFLADRGFDYDRFAYYFERGFKYPQPLARLYSQLVLQIEHWKNLHRQRFVRLSYSIDQDGQLRITDSRFDQTEQYVLPPAAAAVYAALDARPLTRGAVRRAVSSQLSEREFSDALIDLDERRLIWLDGEALLGLAVPDSVAARHEATGWPKHWNAIYV
jgi:ribosomal peptide maturation radical SAM protein 1